MTANAHDHIELTSLPPSRARLAVILMAVTYPSLLTWGYFVLLSSASAAVQQTAYSLGKLLQFGFPVIWVFLTRRHDFRRAENWRAGLGAGFAVGMVVVAAMGALYVAVLQPLDFFASAAAQIQAKVRGMGIDSPAKYAALGVFYALCHALLEEYYWRWFVFGELWRTTTLSSAVLISSLGFMAHHVIILGTFFGWGSPATWLFSAAVGIGGAIWAYLYDRSGSLFGPWISHCLVDAALFTIGYDLVRSSWN